VIPLLADEAVLSAIPYAWAATIIAPLAATCVILYRALRECDAEKLVIAKEYAQATKAEALDGQASRTELHHKMDAVMAKMDVLVEKIQDCTGGRP
jgi:hypothetical protein